MTETDKTNVSAEEGGKTSSSGSASNSVTANGTSNGSTQSKPSSELTSLKNNLRTMWSYNNTKKPGGLNTLNAKLTSIFARYEQPLEEYLVLLDAIIDNGWAGSFSCYVTKQFVNWLYAPETVKPEGGFKADKKIQMRALTVTSKASSKDIMELIFHAYKLSESQELIYPLSKELQGKQKYAQLCHWICLFKVEDKFELNDYIYPMMLTKSYFEIFSYLVGHPDQVTDVVKFADSIFMDENGMAQLFPEMLSPKKYSFVNVSRNIEALLKKIIKHFKISQDITPNFNKKIVDSQIRFYIQNFSRNEMSEESFKECVESICKDDVDRQKFLVQNVLKRTQIQYLAEYFCNLYNLDIEHPKGLQRVEHEGNFHTVDNLDELIVFVDSVELGDSLFEYVDSLAASGTDENNTNSAIPVGIDTEWKSVNTVNVSRPPALLQIAFEKKIFLIDVTVLHDKIEFWQKLNEKLLCNNKFTKLGYGLQDDQCKFDYYPHLSFIKLDGLGSLDILKEEFKYSSRNRSVKFPHDIKDKMDNNSRMWKGLSKLVARCFSKPLDKTEQLSDWERRPLRNAQLKYAALDAYCLIQVYNVLKDMHKKANLRFSIRGEVAENSNKVGYHRENRRWYRPRHYYMSKKKFRNNKNRTEVSVQAVVDSSEVHTQTDKN